MIIVGFVLLKFVTFICKVDVFVLMRDGFLRMMERRSNCYFYVLCTIFTYVLFFQLLNFFEIKKVRIEELFFERAITITYNMYILNKKLVRTYGSQITFLR